MINNVEKKINQAWLNEDCEYDDFDFLLKRFS